MIKNHGNSHYWKGGVHLGIYIIELKGIYYAFQSTFTTLFFNLMVSEKDQNRKKKMYDNNQKLRLNALLAQIFLYPYHVKFV